MPSQHAIKDTEMKGSALIKVVLRRLKFTWIISKIYPFTNRPVVRPKSRWEDDVKNDLKKKLEVVKWSDLVQDGHKWKEIFEKAKTLPEL